MAVRRVENGEDRCRTRFSGGTDRQSVMRNQMGSGLDRGV